LIQHGFYGTYMCIAFTASPAKHQSHRFVGEYATKSGNVACVIFPEMNMKVNFAMMKPSPCIFRVWGIFRM
jgi:hypothetical protein